MANILITGANGFIGSHVSKLMESLGHQIIPLDVTARSPDLSLLGIKTPSHIMNVTDAAAFRGICEKERPTHVFHAAHPPRDETPTVLNYCYHAMTNILEAAKNLKILKSAEFSSTVTPPTLAIMVIDPLLDQPIEIVQLGLRVTLGGEPHF